MEKIQLIYNKNKAFITTFILLIMWAFIVFTPLCKIQVDADYYETYNLFYLSTTLLFTNNFFFFYLIGFIYTFILPLFIIILFLKIRNSLIRVEIIAIIFTIFLLLFYVLFCPAFAEYFKNFFSEITVTYQVSFYLIIISLLLHISNCIFLFFDKRKYSEQDQNIAAFNIYKIFAHFVKFNKWYLLSAASVWVLCLWLVPIQIGKINGNLLSYAYLYNVLRYFEWHDTMLHILAISAIILSLVLLLNAFLKVKHKRITTSFIIAIYVIYSVIVGIADTKSPVYAITHLLFALLYFILLYSDKILLKLQSHKQSPLNAKQKLETQAQQIADLQKQIDELKINHKTEE